MTYDPDPSPDPEVERVLAGGGEAGALARSVDWSRTAIGPVSGWSRALRSTAALVLHNQCPMLLWWGPKFVQIYNDAYRPVLGDKHPRSMGQPLSECWTEVFHIVGPMAERPFRGGPASTSDDLALLVNRNKVEREETHFRVAYSPVPDETVQPTGVGGVLATVTETTEEVFGARQLRTLHELGARSAAEGATVEQACATAAATLADNPWDVPFALFFLLDADGRARRVASVGFDEATIDAAAPRELDLGADAPCHWPLREAATTQRIVVMNDLSSCPVPLPKSPFSDGPRSAIVLPLAAPGQAAAYGVLVCGISPHRVLDSGYRAFFELAAGQIVTALRNARALEEERQRAEALAQIDRAKTTFFSNISHEFRTPLTLMLGPTEDALGAAEPALRGEELQTVHRNQLRLLKLVNTLLDFSRIEAGRVRAHYQPTDLAALTRDLASAFRSAIERGRLAFEVDCPPLPRPVQVDREMWEKIVLNLLSNALKFTFDGKITVRLRDAGDHAYLEVSDTGIGIAEADLPRVFERFHRIEGARARTHEGSGIGLALVHDLTRLHGGRVGVTSALGRGTTFTVSIPFGGAHLPAAASEGPPPPSTAVGAGSFVAEALRWLPDQAEPAAPDAAAVDTAGGRVLFADDNADMRAYVGRLLQRHWRVETVTDGAEALAAARRERPAAILTDVMMPNLDGVELLRALRADPALATIPVIMLSARAGEEARIEGLDAGADDYLVKPFSARELIARVGSQLTLARSREENARERARLFAREQVARHEAELQNAQLHALLMQAPTPMVILKGPDHVVELANPHTCQVWGRTREQVLGRPLFEVLPEFRGQQFEELLAGVLRTGLPYVGRESLVKLDRRQNGTLDDVYFSFVYAPMRGAAGEVEGILVIAFDVTEEVTARNQMDRLRAAAEAATRSKDEFLAMLGHELRNPLSPILTAVQLMRLRGRDGQEVEIIDRQVRHLVRLVDDLLDVSRITRGKIELRRERVELARIALRALETASPLLEQRRQAVDFQIPAEGLEVDGDPDRLAQVVANLVTNASKYSEPGTRIFIGAERAGGQVRLRVADRGIGIAPELLETIFDIFFQQAQSLDRSKGGLGLGLTIVRSLVELHGGTVEARSDGPGRGSEFLVTLPLAVPIGALAPAGAGLAALPIHPAGLSVGRRILIVDDNDDAAQSTGELLAELGHEVRVANDGPSALDVARRFRPEVCLLDIGLPVMDGYELAHRLRESGALPDGARIIAVTGYGQDADRKRSTDAGFSAHVVKPVDLEVLTNVVAN